MKSHDLIRWENEGGAVEGRHVGWRGLTYARAIASGATIYVDRIVTPSLPQEGALFVIDHAGGECASAEIVSPSPETITFDIGRVRWMMVPASEAATRLEKNGHVLQAWLVT